MKKKDYYTKKKNNFSTICYAKYPSGFLSAGEVCEEIGIQRQALNINVNKGYLTYRLLNKKRYYKIEEILNWLEKIRYKRINRKKEDGTNLYDNVKTFSVKAVSLILDCNVHHVYHLMRSKQLSYTPYKGSKIITKEDIDLFRKKREEERLALINI